MAAPYVAGCAALAREWLRTKANWATPSAALVKATLINGTRRIGGTDATAELLGDPNFHQGFGRIDMANTLPNPTVPGMQLAFDDTWQHAARILKDSGQRVRYRLQLGANVPLRICLTWTDHPANGLQNRLVLLVDDGAGQKWIGNTGAAAVLTISGNPLDPHNNVQVVRVPNPKAGNYMIAVVAVDLLFPPQSFAIVATGDLASQLQPA
jgi:serine protease AprX